MGVYIEGIEMPKERDSFTLTIKYNGLVFDTETGIQVAEAREVPSHGRLIDADALIIDKSQEFIHKSMVFGGQYVFSESAILNAPTIIPAEEVYNKYTDTAGNLHWTGTRSGEHTIKAENK